MQANPYEAPPGYIAQAQSDDNIEERPCQGCAFWQVVAGRNHECTRASAVSCMPYRRNDRAAVIFVRQEAKAA